MKIVYSEDHRQHFPQGELSGGEFVTPYERPSRVEYILRELKKRKMTNISAPGVLDMKPVKRVHGADLLHFLEHAWGEWVAAGFRGEILASCFPNRGLQQRMPKAIEGKVGYFTHSL